MAARKAPAAAARPAPAPPPGKPTLKHVSELAGVSTATISRVINNPELVAAETRERVQAAIDKTGYVPNLLAGGLASNRSKLIAAIVPGISTSLFNEMIEAMTRELSAAGYMVVLGMAQNEDAEMDRVLTSLLARRPDGIIITSSERNSKIRHRLKTAGVTVIETWDVPARPMDVAIGFSHAAAGKALADFVADRGYKRPLVISSDHPRAQRRMTAFIDRCLERGLQRPVCDIRSADSFSINGRERLAEHLDGGGKADLVLCTSDIVALGVLAEAAARGIRVPEDLGVIGFGASAHSAISHPALTTVRIDGSKIGKQAAQILIDRSQGREPPRKRIDVGFEIIARDST